MISSMLIHIGHKWIFSTAYSLNVYLKSFVRLKLFFCKSWLNVTQIAEPSPNYISDLTNNSLLYSTLEWKIFHSNNQDENHKVTIKHYLYFSYIFTANYSSKTNLLCALIREFYEQFQPISTLQILPSWKFEFSWQKLEIFKLCSAIKFCLSSIVRRNNKKLLHVFIFLHYRRISLR